MALNQALRLLARPDADSLDRCLTELAKAKDCLEVLASSAARPPEGSGRPAGAELAEWKRSVGRVRGLLEHGAGFWEGWMRLRGTLAGGYTASGGPAETPAAGRLSLKA